MSDPVGAVYPTQSSVRTYVERWTGYCDQFIGSLHTRMSHKEIAIAVAVVLAAASVFAALAPHALNFGDGPIYADRVARGAVFEQAYHVGYNLLAIGFVRLVPLPVDYALNLLNAVLGALSLGLVFSFTYTLVGRWTAGLSAAVLFGGTYLFVENATQAELYISQLFFFLLCAQLILWNRSVLSGLAFAAACLVTPSTVFAAPFLVLLRPKLRFVAMWAASATALLVAFIAPHVQGYLLGPGSLTMTMPADLTLLTALAKESAQIAQFTGGLVLAGIGAYALAGHRRYWGFLFGTFTLWLLAFAVGERYSDVPVQMPFYAIVAVLAGIGFAWLLSARRHRVAVAVLGVVLFLGTLGATGYVGFTEIAELNAESESYRRILLASAESAEPGELAIGAYWASVLAEHYLGGRRTPTIVTSEDLAGANGADQQRETLALLDRAVAAGKRIWLLESSLTAKQGYFVSHGYSIVQYERSPHIYFAVPAQ